MKLRALLVVCAALLLPSLAPAQALTSLSSVRVGYTTRKNTVKPQGELKAQIDALDAQIAEATRLGKNRRAAPPVREGHGAAEQPAVDRRVRVLDARWCCGPIACRRRFVEAVRGAAGTDLRAVDRACRARVDRACRAATSASGAAGARPAAAAAAELVKELGTFEGVARDLRESPFFFDLDLHDVADGPYGLIVNVVESGRADRLGRCRSRCARAWTSWSASLEGDAAQAPEALRAEILFPVDRMKNVNRGRLELRTFDPERDFAAAEAVAAAVKAGKDPFAGRTGDIRRHYRLDAANEILPYRTYVPTTYTGAKAFPLIIALHGLGGTEDAFFDNYDEGLPPLAESHGYIVAAPLGYRVDGSYGWGLGKPPADPDTRRTQDFSEQDVMQVLQRMRQLYKIDDSRIYLMGHSMGAIGTWKIAPKYPDIWAAIAPFSGSGAPATLEKIRSVPEIHRPRRRRSDGQRRRVARRWWRS